MPGEILPFRVGSAIAYAWRMTWKKFGWLLLLGLLLTVLTTVANLPGSLGSFSEIDPTDPNSVSSLASQITFSTLSIIGLVLQVFISIFFGIGLVRIALGATAGEGIRLEKIFRFDGFGRYLGVGIIINLIIGFALVIIVGAGAALSIALNQVVWVAVSIVLAILVVIVVSVMFSMYGYAIVDQDVRGLGSLGASWRIVRPHFWALIGLNVLVGLIVVGLFVAAVIIGVLLIIIGLLATIPLAATVALGLSILSQGYAYRTMTGQPVSSIS